MTPSVGSAQVQPPPRTDRTLNAGKFKVEAAPKPRVCLEIQTRTKTGWRAIGANNHSRKVDNAIAAQTAYVQFASSPTSALLPVLQSALKATWALADDPKTSMEDRERLIMWCIDAATPVAQELKSNADFAKIAHAASCIYFERATGFTLRAELTATSDAQGVVEEHYTYRFSPSDKPEQARDPVDWLRAVHWHSFNPSNGNLASEANQDSWRSPFLTPPHEIGPSSTLTAHEVELLQRNELPWKLPGADSFNFKESKQWLEKPGDRGFDALGTLARMYRSQVRHELRSGGLQNFVPGDTFEPQISEPHVPNTFVMGHLVAQFLEGDFVPPDHVAAGPRCTNEDT